MHKEVWEFPVALYLFLGGLSSSAYYVGVLAELFSKGKYKNLARVGSYLVLVPSIIGLVMLLADLGRPLYFWHLIIQFTPSFHVVLQQASILSIGVWLLILFIPVCGVIYPAFWLAEEKFGGEIPIVKLLKGRERLRRITGYIGLVLALPVSIYTGVLLAASSAELWGATPFLPILFVASAGSAGIAAIIITLACLGELDNDVVSKLISADIVYIILELLALAFLLVTLLAGGQAVEAIKRMLIGNLAVLFWIGVGVVGILLPYLMDEYHLRVKKCQGMGLPVAAATLGLFGALFLRYMFLMAGYVK